MRGDTIHFRSAGDQAGSPVAGRALPVVHRMISAAGRAVAWRGTGYDVVRLVLAALLLTAAGLKAHQLATAPILGDGPLDSRWLLLATVEFELLFGLWLLSGLYPKQTWAAALACFALFAGVSLYKGLSGATSCGCFGRVEVDPSYTLMLDLGAIVALLRFRPARRKDAVRAPVGECGRAAVPVFGSLTTDAWGLPRFLLVSAIFIFFGLPLAWATGGRAVYRQENGLVGGEGNMMILQPEKWLGEQFPLLPYIDIQEELADGEWLVVLYRRGCEQCDELLSSPSSLRQAAGRELGHPSVAWINVASGVDVGGGDDAAPASPAGHTVTELDPTRNWFASTPTLVWLRQRRVEAVRTPASKTWMTAQGG